MSTVSNYEKKLQRKHHWSLFYNVDNFLGIVFTESHHNKKNLSSKWLENPSWSVDLVSTRLYDCRDFNKCWICYHIKVIWFCAVFFIGLFHPVMLLQYILSPHQSSFSVKREMSQFGVLVGIQRLAILRLGMGSGWGRGGRWGRGWAAPCLHTCTGHFHLPTFC